MEEDYLALEHHSAEHPSAASKDATSGISSAIIKEVLLPEIEKEVNEGKTFAKLRQIYNSLILAAWYKQNLRESLLGQVYADKAKTGGLTVEDKETTQKIYTQYLEAFQKGVYNFIREDVDPATQEIIPRKYFSGGVSVTHIPVSSAANPALLKTFAEGVHPFTVSAGISSLNGNISYTMPFPKAAPSVESPEESASSPLTLKEAKKRTIEILQTISEGEYVSIRTSTTEEIKDFISQTDYITTYQALENRLNHFLRRLDWIFESRRTDFHLHPANVEKLFAEIAKLSAIRDQIQGRGSATISPEESASSPMASAKDERRGTEDELGGIDLNPGNMEMETNYGADRIRLPMPTIPLENIKIDGLVPVIIHVAPVTNLPMLLGIVNSENPSDAADSNSAPLEIGWAVKEN